MVHDFVRQRLGHFLQKAREIAQVVGRQDVQSIHLERSDTQRIRAFDSQSRTPSPTLQIY